MNASAFGDRLQADIVYIRTLSQNVPVLGIVDEFTNYIVATTLTDRHPATVLKTFLTMWYHPLGLPQHLTVDPDTAFLGNMEEWHARHGIEYEIIPAEEHWRIGKIERRNALLRTLVERLVDHHAVVSREALDEVIVAACHSLNSSTYSYGRSPFQAVFGRIPRPLGDLLSDDKALVISNNDNQIFRPELLRAEAVTTLMQDFRITSCTPRPPPKNQTTTRSTSTSTWTDHCILAVARKIPAAQKGIMESGQILGQRP